MQPFEVILLSYSGKRTIKPYTRHTRMEIKLHVVAFLLLSLLSCNNSSKSEASDPQLASLVSSKETSKKPAPAPDANGRVPGEIPYQSYWAYMNDRSRNDFWSFFDGELEKNPDFGPSGERKVNPSEMWFPFPEEMEAVLEEIHFYDWKGTLPVPMKTYFIERGSWKRIEGPTFTGDQYKQWIEHRLKKPLNIAYIVFEDASRSYPTEIKFIGSHKPYTPKEYIQKPVKLKDMLGVNTYVWNFLKASRRGVNLEKVEAGKNFSAVRDYVDWVKIEPADGMYSFSPVRDGGWEYDLYYKTLKDNDIEVLTCFKTVAPWAQEEFYPKGMRNSENSPSPWTKLPEPVKPEKKAFAQEKEYEKAREKYEAEQAAYDADIAAIRLDPKSYVKFSKAAFQFVARYGSNKKLDPKLVTPFSGNGDEKLKWIIQEKKIGLDYIKVIECNNEPNAWWKGRKRYQTAREYAANLSAFYDGHMGTMGPGVGVKNADPNILVAMGGVADNSPAYVQGIIDWCKEFRGYKPDGSVNLCFDIANYHGYANNGGGQYSKSSWGLPPEVTPLHEKVTTFLQVMKEFGNDVPVYITELGYDVNGSSQQALASPTRSKLQAHGDWIIRSCLYYARQGISKLYFYQLYDESGYAANVRAGKEDNGTYGASGLIDNNTLTRRPAADYMAQLGSKFGEYAYKQTINKDPFVDIYELKGQRMYALVVPDMKSRTEDFELNLGTTHANIYEFADGSLQFKITKVPTVKGKLKVKVTETPQFIEGVK